MSSACLELARRCWATGFVTLPGGKGANQAYAAARLGASVRMIGAVGQDILGARLRANLESAGVDVSLVQENSAEPSGVALISVDAQGQNTIVVAPRREWGGWRS